MVKASASQNEEREELSTSTRTNALGHKMEEPPPMETVYQAINALYFNRDPEERNEANRWLIDLQKSVHAWKVADQLLQRQTDLNSCCLGAQIIRAKIMTSFHELPHDAVLSLHNSLMQHLREVTKDTETIIVTQLCLSVVDLSLQMNTWNNPIHSFLSQRDAIPHWILLDILKVFPEELDTESIRLGLNRRNEVENELSNCAALLNDYLNQVISKDIEPETLLKAIQCFTSWINVVRNLTDVLEKCHLIQKVFQILSNPADGILETSSTIESRIHDAASELLCSVLRALRGPDADRFLDLDLYTKVAEFECPYQISVAHENTEKAINYCQIFSELGEAFLVKMVNETRPGSPHFSIKILDLILTCTKHHDYDVSAFTFSFWFSLAELLYNENDDRVSEAFKPYIDQLLVKLRGQVQMEPDSEGLLGEDDDFKIFREKVCDLVRDSIFIVGSTNHFCQIFSSIQNNDKLLWYEIEANLFIMYAIAWKISPEESNVVPLTVESIFNIPETVHVAIRYTAILILGELRDWFDEHPPEFLISALRYLERCLHSKELAEAAASSLCYICCTAKTQLKNQFSILRDIHNRHALTVSNKAAINIIKSVVSVMCQLPTEEMRVALKEICSYHTKLLLEVSQNRLGDETPVEKKSNADLISLVDRLAAIFRYVQRPSSSDMNGVQNDVRMASADAFLETQPILFQIMDVYQKDMVIMERCCRCLRFAIRALEKIGDFMIDQLIRKLVELYRANGHSCFLYLGSILVDEFGEDASTWPSLLQMVDLFIEPTFALLQSPNGFRSHPDTVDDLFRLCSRILQRLPNAFLSSAGVLQLIECGLVAVSVEHREANASVMKFFHEIFDCTNEDNGTKNIAKRQLVQPLYEKHGEELVRNLIHASVFILPSFTLINIAEVLYDLILFDAKVTHKWIELAVLQLPNRSSTGNLMASPEQIQTFLNAFEQGAKMRDISRGLRDFTLYYR